MPIILFLVAGIILLANPGWFGGAHLVGLILTIIGGIGTAIFVLVVLLAGGVTIAAWRDTGRRRGRGVRGSW